MAKRIKVDQATKRLNKQQVQESTQQIKKQNTKSSEDIDRSQRVALSTRINPELRDKMKILAIQENKRFTDLLEEALTDLINKYGNNQP